jgi:hypothetical protein
LKTDSCEALVYPDRRDLCELGRASQGSRAESSPIPLFLRDVGKYYWISYYALKEYTQGYVQPYKSPYVIGISSGPEGLGWFLENSYFRALKYFDPADVVNRACRLGVNIVKYIEENRIGKESIDWSDFYQACINCDLEMVKCLEKIYGPELGALPHICSSCPTDRLQIVEFLYPKIPEDESILHLLLECCRANKVQILKFLLSKRPLTVRRIQRCLQCVTSLEVAEILVEEWRKIN